MSYETEWKKAYGIDRDPVREILIYPLLLAELPDLKNASLVDLGCGNGGLIHRLLEKPLSKAVGLDASKAFLKEAQQLIADKRVAFKETDITKALPLEKHEVDCIVSVFVLNEIRDIAGIFEECGRILKPAGSAHFVVTHPFLVMQEILHQKYAGKPLGKLSGELDYKGREQLKYHFTLADASGPFFQHTFEEYVEVITMAGLRLEKMIELRTDAVQFKELEKYWREKEIPKYLYFRVVRDTKL